MAGDPVKLKQWIAVEISIGAWGSFVPRDISAEWWSDMGRDWLWMQLYLKSIPLLFSSIHWMIPQNYSSRGKKHLSITLVPFFYLSPASNGSTSVSSSKYILNQSIIIFLYLFEGEKTDDKQHLPISVLWKGTKRNNSCREVCLKKLVF